MQPRRKHRSSIRSRKRYHYLGLLSENFQTTQNISGWSYHDRVSAECPVADPYPIPALQLIRLSCLVLWKGTSIVQISHNILSVWLVVGWNILNRPITPCHMSRSFHVDGSYSFSSGDFPCSCTGRTATGRSREFQAQRSKDGGNGQISKIFPNSNLNISTHFTTKRRKVGKWCQLDNLWQTWPAEKWRCSRGVLHPMCLQLKAWPRTVRLHNCAFSPGLWVEVGTISTQKCIYSSKKCPGSGAETCTWSYWCGHNIHTAPQAYLGRSGSRSPLPMSFRPHRLSSPAFRLWTTQKRGWPSLSNGWSELIQHGGEFFPTPLCGVIVFDAVSCRRRLTPPPPPPPVFSLTQLFVTHHLSHTTLTHNLSHTQLCHTPSFTTLCHTPSFTHNTQLCHTPSRLCHTQLCHKPSQLCHTPSFTHNFLSHTIFHKHLSAVLCVAGVALGDVDLHFVWQAWHLRHWVGSGALGHAGSPGAPHHFAWQACHLVTSTLVSRGRRGTCGTGLALVARLGALGRPQPLAWQAWRLVTSTLVALGTLGWLWWRGWARWVARGAMPLCVAGVALGEIHLGFCVAGVALGDIHLGFA